MSLDIYRYIGYKTKENKIYPLGPYDSFGKLIGIWENGYESELGKYFVLIPKDMETKELRDEFMKHSSMNRVNDDDLGVFYAYLDELPVGTYIRKGYFLREEIAEYESGQVSRPYHCLTEREYGLQLESEAKFGPPKPKKDEYGTEYTPPACSEYSYYMFPDYDSVEYEVDKIRQVAELLQTSDIPEDSKMVVLEIMN